ncbi:MAG: J domain-containing protein [Dehalococcoidia bacterium]|nr:J domain-containing protein [Dehalococcoidia bacterium]
MTVERDDCKIRARFAMAQDFYTELGVPRNAADKDVKAAYRRLARRYHPDVNTSDADAEARFKRVNEAYQVLSDPKTRRDYDQFGDNWKHAEQMRAHGGPGGFRRSRGGHPGFGGIDLNDLFGGSGFGNAFGRSQRQSLRTNVQVTLEEAYAGSKRAITIQGSSTCRECGGTGVDGTVLCSYCGGSGTSSMPRTLEVTIPKGTAAGDRIRVRPDETTDLTIEVDVRRHRVFTRKDDDLSTEVTVSYLDALLGGEVEVPTMTGKVALKIPAGTVEGRSFRVTGKGMPRHGRGAAGVGDLLARMVISVPGESSEEERSLLEHLRDLRDRDSDGPGGKTDDPRTDPVDGGDDRASQKSGGDA